MPTNEAAKLSSLQLDLDDLAFRTATTFGTPERTRQGQKVWQVELAFDDTDPYDEYECANGRDEFSELTFVSGVLWSLRHRPSSAGTTIKSLDYHSLGCVRTSSGLFISSFEDTPDRYDIEHFINTNQNKGGVRTMLKAVGVLQVMHAALELR